MSEQEANMSALAVARQQEDEDERYERQPQAARETFPDRRIFEMPGDGFLAVPADTPTIHALSIDDLVDKLRKEGVPLVEAASIDELVGELRKRGA
jgi:hypothetical protein